MPFSSRRLVSSFARLVDRLRASPVKSPSSSIVGTRDLERALADVRCVAQRVERGDAVAREGPERLEDAAHLGADRVQVVATGVI